MRFALERLLYRLGQSVYVDHFLLKGALLFALWYDMPHRHTRDADLLGLVPSDIDAIEKTFRDIASLVVEDGIVFLPGSVIVEPSRKDGGVTGARVHIEAKIAQARCKTQIDIGYGDAVTPPPMFARYPVLLKDFPAPQLRVYPVYTVIAEKLHAIAVFGMTNTRLKDYLDLFVLLKRETLEQGILSEAVAATFAQRGTPPLARPPVGLSDEFAQDGAHQAMWLALLKKNDLTPMSLTSVVTDIRARLQATFSATRKSTG